MTQSIQTATLLLADGRRLYFTGRYQIDPAELDGCRVTEVYLSEAIPLPAGCRIETMRNIEEARE